MLALALSVAVAAPLDLTHQGRLLDPAGEPYQGEVRLAFTLYDQPADGVVVWTETHPNTPVDDGYYAVTLGSQTPLSTSILDGTTLYLGVTVDGVALGGRQPLGSVPYAARAGVADVAEQVAPGSGVVRRLGQAVQTDGVDHSDQTWVDLPGTAITVDVPEGVVVALRSHGSAHVRSGPQANSHCGFRFVVDDVGQGNNSWGDVLVGCSESASASAGSGWWCPWSMSRQMELPPGPHDFRLQMTGWDGSDNDCHSTANSYGRAWLFIDAF